MCQRKFCSRVNAEKEISSDLKKYNKPKSLGKEYKIPC